jgi:hypothetical protein
MGGAALLYGACRLHDVVIMKLLERPRAAGGYRQSEHEVGNVTALRTGRFYSREKSLEVIYVRNLNLGSKGGRKGEVIENSQ